MNKQIQSTLRKVNRNMMKSLLELGNLEATVIEEIYTDLEKAIVKSNALLTKPIPIEITQNDSEEAKFNRAFSSFIDKVKAMIKTYYTERFPELPLPKVKIDTGRKYMRIWTDKSCWGFVDRANGNILKPATWKRPAKKHARGNIFDDDQGMSNVGPYGPKYIRG